MSPVSMVEASDSRTTVAPWDAAPVFATSRPPAPTSTTDPSEATTTFHDVTVVGCDPVTGPGSAVAGSVAARAAVLGGVVRRSDSLLSGSLRGGWLLGGSLRGGGVRS
jgi:hypothetical protein